MRLLFSKGRDALKVFVMGVWIFAGTSQLLSEHISQYVVHSFVKSFSPVSLFICFFFINL